jgi:hypothetical protein
MSQRRKGRVEGVPQGRPPRRARLDGREPLGPEPPRVVPAELSLNPGQHYRYGVLDLGVVVEVDHLRPGGVQVLVGGFEQSPVPPVRQRPVLRLLSSGRPPSLFQELGDRRRRHPQVRRGFAFLSLKNLQPVL